MHPHEIHYQYINIQRICKNTITYKYKIYYKYNILVLMYTIQDQWKVQYQYTRYRHGSVSRAAKQYKAAQHSAGQGSQSRASRAWQGGEGYDRAARGARTEQGKVPGQGRAYQYVRLLYRPCTAILALLYPGLLWVVLLWSALCCHGLMPVLSWRALAILTAIP